MGSVDLGDESLPLSTRSRLAGFSASGVMGAELRKVIMPIASASLQGRHGLHSPPIVVTAPKKEKQKGNGINVLLIAFCVRT